MSEEEINNNRELSEERLMIKKIRKYDIVSKFYGSLAIFQGIVSGSLTIAGIYSFIRGIRKEYFCDSAFMTYPAGLFALGLAVIAALEIPEIYNERDKYRNQVLMLKEELQESKKEGIIK